MRYAGTQASNRVTIAVTMVTVESLLGDEGELLMFAVALVNKAAV